MPSTCAFDGKISGGFRPIHRRLDDVDEPRRQCGPYVHRPDGLTHCAAGRSPCPTRSSPHLRLLAMPADAWRGSPVYSGQRPKPGDALNPHLAGHSWSILGEGDAALMSARRRHPTVMVAGRAGGRAAARLSQTLRIMELPQVRAVAARSRPCRHCGLRRGRRHGVRNRSPSSRAQHQHNSSSAHPAGEGRSLIAPDALARDPVAPLIDQTRAAMTDALRGMEGILPVPLAGQRRIVEFGPSHLSRRSGIAADWLDALFVRHGFTPGDRRS